MSYLTTKSCWSYSLFTVILFGLAWTARSEQSDAQDTTETQSHAIRAVDGDMHHFMEYVFEPNFKRLKATMSQPPKERSTWTSIKGDSLTLAECANLLLTRAPEDEAQQWKSTSVAVREAAAALYQAARGSNYEAARNAYNGMITKCNSCHQQFADGEHQLKP